MCRGNKGETDCGKLHRRRTWVKGSHLFVKGLFESVSPKRLMRENGLVLELIPHAAMSLSPPGWRSRGLSGQCYFNPACLAVWTALLSYVHVCFEVNRNLIFHFLIVSWSCNNAAFCASRIVDIRARVRVFVFLNVCESVCWYSSVRLAVWTETSLTLKGHKFHIFLWSQTFTEASCECHPNVSQQGFFFFF